VLTIFREHDNAFVIGSKNIRDIAVDTLDADDGFGAAVVGVRSPRVVADLRGPGLIGTQYCGRHEWRGDKR